ncbi:alpha/beta hydrolase [Flavobacteriaceae bacterium]|nr:alpha/beta hydrolase [Flavobacteriaceae bacterium]MDA9865879.1 alpha/beta hydrolase [Flavobacteriaceae bacterium]
MKKLLYLILLIPIFVSAQILKSFESSDGTEIYYEEFGQGKTLILLSGGPGLNPDYLKELSTTLSKKYKCITLHQRGTGKSILEEVSSQTVNVDRYIEDLNGLYKELGNQKLILVGHSWGGMLSFSYAANEPEKIEKIILLNTGGVTDKFYSWFGSNINMRLFPEDLELYQSQIDNKRSTLVAIWPGYFFDREMALKSRPALDYKFNNQAGINSLASGDWRKRSEERVERLKNYTGPIDLITGRQDPVGESVVYEAKTVFPQLNYTFIERCGHFPWLEREDRSKIFYDLFDKSLDLN